MLIYTCGDIMKNIHNTIDNILIALGATWSLANIQTLLGIIVLVFQIVWLTFKLIVKIINKIKTKGNLDELDKEVDKITDKINSIGDEDE